MDASTQFKRSPLAMALLGILHLKPPMHPYAVQHRLKDWGEDRVVNVGQRAALYKTIARLQEAGLVAVRETGRDQQYPERTVYEITDAGRAAVANWLAEMVALPRNEYPDFPAALSFLMLLARRTRRPGCAGARTHCAPNSPRSTPTPSDPSSSRCRGRSCSTTSTCARSPRPNCSGWTGWWPTSTPEPSPGPWNHWRRTSTGRYPGPDRDCDAHPPGGRN